MDHNNYKAYKKIRNIREQIFLMRRDGSSYTEILDYIRHSLWSLYSEIGTLFSENGYNRLIDILIKDLNDIF